MLNAAKVYFSTCCLSRLSSPLSRKKRFFISPCLFFYSPQVLAEHSRVYTAQIWLCALARTHACMAVFRSKRAHGHRSVSHLEIRPMEHLTEAVCFSTDTEKEARPDDGQPERSFGRFYSSRYTVKCNKFTLLLRKSQETESFQVKEIKKCKV